MSRPVTLRTACQDVNEGEYQNLYRKTNWSNMERGARLREKIEESWYERRNQWTCFPQPDKKPIYTWVWREAIESSDADGKLASVSTPHITSAPCVGKARKENFSSSRAYWCTHAPVFPRLYFLFSKNPFQSSWEVRTCTFFSLFSHPPPPTYRTLCLLACFLSSRKDCSEENGLGDGAPIRGEEDPWNAMAFARIDPT